MVNTRNNNCNN
jgi:hypothetical protein